MNKYVPSELINLTRSKDKVMRNVVQQLEKDPKNNRSVWQFNTITVILTAVVLVFLATQSMDTLRQTASNESDSNEVFELPEVEMMDKIVVQDYIEFTIQSNNFGEIIKPSNPEPTYPIYLMNGNKGEIYLDTLVTVRNISKTELSEADDAFMSIKIIHDDKKEYTSFTKFERVGESKFTGLNNSIIEPLQTRVVHFLTSVPASLEKDSKPLKAVITVNGEKYEHVIR